MISIDSKRRGIQIFVFTVLMGFVAGHGMMYHQNYGDDIIQSFSLLDMNEEETESESKDSQSEMEFSEATSDFQINRNFIEGFENLSFSSHFPKEVHTDEVTPPPEWM